MKRTACPAVRTFLGQRTLPSREDFMTPETRVVWNRRTAVGKLHR